MNITREDAYEFGDLSTELDTRCVNIYIYICIYIYIYIYICIYIFIYIYYMNVYEYTWMERIFVNLAICLMNLMISVRGGRYEYKCTCLYIYIYLHIHRCIYIRTFFFWCLILCWFFFMLFWFSCHIHPSFAFTTVFCDLDHEITCLKNKGDVSIVLISLWGFEVHTPQCVVYVCMYKEMHV